MAAKPPPRLIGPRLPRAPKPSMRKAINAMCKDCIYDPLCGGSWRAQTEACTSTECPLYPLRPRMHASKVKIQDNTSSPSTHDPAPR